VQTVRYGPYGENTNTSGTVAYSTTNDPFLFQGGYHTAGGNAGTGNVPNGLYHYGARYYDPTIGRWTQPDPAASLPEYAFAEDDPVNNMVPSGEITTHADEYLTCEALQQENRHDPRNDYYFDRKTYAYCQWVFRSYTRQVVEGLLKIKGSVHFHLTGDEATQRRDDCCDQRRAYWRRRDPHWIYEPGPCDESRSDCGRVADCSCLAIKDRSPSHHAQARLGYPSG
jgi:RHS repeat-associated protein